MFRVNQYHIRIFQCEWKCERRIDISEMKYNLFLPQSPTDSNLIKLSLKFFHLINLNENYTFFITFSIFPPFSTHLTTPIQHNVSSSNSIRSTATHALPLPHFSNHHLLIFSDPIFYSLFYFMNEFQNHKSN